MIISLIAAIGPNREMGLDGRLPWHIPEDFKYFKKVTSHHYIVMGRKTFESLGKALPNRIHLVLSSQPGKNTDDVIWPENLLTAFTIAAKAHDSELFVIG